MSHDSVRENPEIQREREELHESCEKWKSKSSRYDGCHHDHRMQLQCSRDSCVVNLHAKDRRSSPSEICRAMEKVKAFVETSKPEIKRLNFIGDFNESASSLVRQCTALPGLKVSTYTGPGQSCSDNNGGHNPENIDLFATLDLNSPRVPVNAQTREDYQANLDDALRRTGGGAMDPRSNLSFNSDVFTFYAQGNASYWASNFYKIPNTFRPISFL